METAIRANALIFAAKLAVFFMSNSRCALYGRQGIRKASSYAITNGSCHVVGQVPGVKALPHSREML